MWYLYIIIYYILCNNLGLYDNILLPIIYLILINWTVVLNYVAGNEELFHQSLCNHTMS